MIVNHHFTVEVGLNETTPPEVGLNETTPPQYDVMVDLQDADMFKVYSDMFRSDSLRIQQCKSVKLGYLPKSVKFGYYKKIQKKIFSSFFLLKKKETCFQ
jgi:hypothetical protein